MTTMETTTTNDDWLSNAISQIISSPHISFPKPTGSLPFRTGPGPVDLFSTRFNNTFAYDVEVTVDGEVVSRDDLKAKLLSLQKYWNVQEIKFQDKSAGLRSETVVEFSSGKAISMRAETEVEGSIKKIKIFSLDIDPSLFK